MGVADYSTTSDSNTALAPEQMTPGLVNNAIRQVQADIATAYRDGEWIEYGQGDGSGDGTSSYSIAYLAADQFAVTSDDDITAAYHVGRMVRAESDAIGTIYGEITATTWDVANTRVVVTATWDSGGLVNESGIRVWLGILSADGRALPRDAMNGRDIDFDDHEARNAKLIGYSVGRQSVTLASGVAAIDLADGNSIYILLDDDLDTLTVANWAASPNESSVTVYLQQDGTGERAAPDTLWPAQVEWAGDNPPVVSTTAWHMTIVYLVSLNGGSNVMGNWVSGIPFSGAVG